MMKLEQENNCIREELKRVQAGNAQPAGHQQTAVAAASSIAYAGNYNDGVGLPHIGPVSNRSLASQADCDDEMPRSH